MLMRIDAQLGEQSQGQVYDRIMKYENSVG